MTEVPEHLLRRSRERRAALGLGGGDDEGAPASREVAETAAATPAPAAAETAEVAEVAPVIEEPPPPRVVAPRARVPVWAMPMLLLLPVWAVLYTGAFGEREAGPGGDGPGPTLFAGNCASCHGSAGQGGTGPALSEVAETFPEFSAHVEWVRVGSAPVKGQPYGATNRGPATGGMPAFGESLTEQEIIDVVCYERTKFGGEEPPQECTETPAEGGEPESAEG